MAKSLSWKVQVVRNISIIVLVLITFRATAQSSYVKITYSCQSAALETVINHLAKTTGLHFVYSSNKITPTAPVTLSAENKSLNEILSVLGKQLNLSFKIQDHYVTVKTNDLPLPLKSEPVALKKPDNTAVVSVHHLASIAQQQDAPELNSQKIIDATTMRSHNGDISAYVVKLQQYFDTSVLKKVPFQYVKATAKHVHPSWFASVGAVLNNYSMGVEVQVGLRQAYLVFSPTWLSNDQFHGAFGLGTSLQISNHFSLRPVYTYASMSKKETSNSTGSIKLPAYQVTSNINHHQVKLMLQYALNKKFSFRAGPTFNQSKTTYKYQPVAERYVSFNNAMNSYQGPSEEYRNGSRTTFSTHIVKTPTDAAVNNFWIGWEASFAYRINF